MIQTNMEGNKLPTIREMLKDAVLDDRAKAALETRFDKVVEVVREGDKLVVPQGLRPEKALEIVKAWVDGETQKIGVELFIDGIPIDAAHALTLAVKHEYGVMKLEPGFWGTPPPFFSVPTSYRGENTEVYVGTFTLPGFDKATLQTAPDDENLRLKIYGTVLKKDMTMLNQLLDTARGFLQTHSLYKGKAITIDFGKTQSSGGVEMVLPQFWDISSEKALILDKITEAMLGATLWTPITDRDLVKKMGTPIKRTILLYGIYGTGKTLAAYKTARIAVANGFTFLYVKNIDHLQSAIDFAGKQLLPAVLFMEDTEKAFEDPEKINAIQNTLDGIDTKDRDLIIVLTTNHVRQLPSAIMRPGRLDTIINLPAADAETAVRLVQHYAGNMMDPNSDLKAIGAAVQGNIPATIREIVERSKLFALSRTKTTDFKINHEDVQVSTHSMDVHIALLNGEKEHKPSPAAEFGYTLGHQVGAAVQAGITSLVNGKAMQVVASE